MPGVSLVTLKRACKTFDESVFHFIKKALRDGKIFIITTRFFGGVNLPPTLACVLINHAVFVYSGN